MSEETSTETTSIRCEGWTRIGAFIMGGTPGWQQCKKDAIVILTVTQDEGEVTEQPACLSCWEEGKKHNIPISNAVPVEGETPFNAD